LPDGIVKGSTEIGTYTYIEAMPKTGRTHQIRVHFRHLNHPVICDTLYATGREEALGFKRLALHAYKITFKKFSGEDITVEAPLPEDFVAAEGLAPTPISM
jgi:23S rRNA-/tRNA-specific pseudouridylate synthase